MADNLPESGLILKKKKETTRRIELMRKIRYASPEIRVIRLPYTISIKASLTPLLLDFSPRPRKETGEQITQFRKLLRVLLLQ